MLHALIQGASSGPNVLPARLEECFDLAVVELRREVGRRCLDNRAEGEGACAEPLLLNEEHVFNVVDNLLNVDSDDILFVDYDDLLFCR